MRRLWLLRHARPGARPAVVRRRQRAAADDRSLRPRQVDRAGDRRPGRADLRARARAGGQRRCAARRAPIASCCSSTAPARRPKSRSTCRSRTTAGWRIWRSAGFDVFAMDTTGYGRSTRPAAMNDPCNLARDRQAAFVPSLIAAPCAPSYPHAMTTIASDWNDIGARRRLRPRAAARRQGQPARVVARRPARRRLRGAASREGAEARAARAGLQPQRRRRRRRRRCRPTARAMNTQSREEFDANWDRQVGCPAQYEPAVGDAVWSEMLASDPVGATWGPGVRRAPQTATWGWNAGGGGEDADADADGRRAARQAGGARSRARALRRSRARRRRCSSISPARRTTRCGRRTACCCSARRSSG